MNLGIGFRQLAAAVTLVAAVWPASVFAQEQKTLRGVALVIGQSDYEHLSALPNPTNDARAIEEMLSGLGFETDLASDRDARRLKRDLEGFVEDAEDADVAVIYYSGHGIEAGGENWLVPVDADVSAAADAGEKLVPLSAIVEELKASVPVTIVLLDACRNDPFPAGTLLKRDASDAGQPISAGGLAQTRGAVGLAPAPDKADVSAGTVIAFAAEPGKVALDGAAGGNSPYAAAVLRHFDAMAGEEFGTVMRMIAEEVYLKTGGKQRPWINESLRRLLYFGVAEQPPAGGEGEILAERRQLLLTIAALPEVGRKQVERVAAQGDVPMDALYGILRALGTEAPSDPSRLDAVLREQSERLREIMGAHQSLTSTDPEIVRLASLADEAVGEGALRTAIRLHERAKERVAELSTQLDDVEAEIRERRIEFARVFAESAAAYELVFDYAAAAADYDRAFEQIERWDDQLAWNYRRSSVIAAYRNGEYSGSVAPIEALVAGKDATLQVASRLGTPAARAEALLQTGNVFNVLGRLRAEAEPYRQAIGYYDQAIPLFEAAGDGTGVNRARHNLASALSSLGGFEAGVETLQRSVAIYRDLAAQAPFDTSQRDWISARVNLAVAIGKLGERSGDTALAREALAVNAEIVDRFPRDLDPVQWTLARFNQAGLMLFIGEREGNPRMLADSVKANEEVQQFWTREAFPIYWASAHNNMGNAYQVLGVNLNDEQFLRAAEYEYRDVLEEWRRDRVPNDWAMATNNLANVLKKLGASANDLGRLDEAIRLYGDCLSYWTRADKPLHWASAQNNLGDGLFILGGKRGDAGQLRASVAAFDAALEEWTRERVPYDWAVATNNRGGALVELGALTRSADDIRKGIADIETAWAYDKGTGETGYDDYYTARLADARAKLAKAGG